MIDSCYYEDCESQWHTCGRFVIGGYLALKVGITCNQRAFDWAMGWYLPMLDGI